MPPPPTPGRGGAPILGIVVGVALVAVVLVAGVLALVVSPSEEEDEATFRPVGSSIGEPISPQVASTTSSTTEYRDPKEAEREHLVPWAQELMAMGILNGDFASIAKNSPLDSSPTSWCVEAPVRDLGGHSMVATGGGWEIDLTLLEFSSSAQSGDAVRQLQDDAYTACMGDAVTAWSKMGKMRGEVVEERQVTEGPDVSRSIVIKGSLERCDGTLIVSTRQIEQYTLSVRLFDCDPSPSDPPSRKPVTFDQATADTITDYVVHQVQG